MHRQWGFIFDAQVSRCPGYTSEASALVTLTGLKPNLKWAVLWSCLHVNKERVLGIATFRSKGNILKMPKKTVDVQVTTVDAVLEFSIEVGVANCHEAGWHHCSKTFVFSPSFSLRQSPQASSCLISSPEPLASERCGILDFDTPTRKGSQHGSDLIKRFGDLKPSSRNCPLRSQIWIKFRQTDIFPGNRMPFHVLICSCH